MKIHGGSGTGAHGRTELLTPSHNQKTRSPFQGELSEGLRGCLLRTALRSKTAQRLGWWDWLGPFLCSLPHWGGGTQCVKSWQVSNGCAVVRVRSVLLPGRCADAGCYTEVGIAPVALRSFAPSSRKRWSKGPEG